LTGMRVLVGCINGEAGGGKRWLRPPVDRYSITKFSPSMYPYSRNVLRKTFMLGVLSSRDALSSTPIRQISSSCCACAVIGSAAAALSAAMNSRRLMGLPLRTTTAPYQIEPEPCCASQQKLAAQSEMGNNR